MLNHSELPDENRMVRKINTVSVTELAIKISYKLKSYISFHLVSATVGYVSN